MRSEPLKVLVNSVRHRGAACNATRVVLSRRALRFLWPSESIEDAENELLSDDLMEPREVLARGRFYSESNQQRVLEFDCTHLDAAEIEDRVVAAFFHNSEAHKLYGYPHLKVNGHDRGATKALVDLLRRELAVRAN